MARSRKTTKTSKRQTYTVTLEVMTPVQCVFDVKASSPAAAIEQALLMDWEEFTSIGSEGDGPTYCVSVEDAAGNELPVPHKYTAKTINKENN